jgi:TRAP-type C4-dicarboxylate transport system permease small subunit
MATGSQRELAQTGAITRVGNAVAEMATIGAAVALAIIVAVNGANVVGRYILGKPLAWAEEFMLFLMVFVVFFGCIAVTWQMGHIHIDALVTRLSERSQRIVAVAMQVLGVGLLGTVAYYGYGIVALLYAFDQRSDALDAPMWIPQGIVVFGLAASAVLLLVRAVQSAVAGKAGE